MYMAALDSDNRSAYIKYSISYALRGKALRGLRRVGRGAVEKHIEQAGQEPRGSKWKGTE